MKKYWYAPIAASLIALAVSARPALAVNEGTVDDGSPARYPNVGAMVIVARLGVAIEPFVLGSISLIDPRVVLTAGHITDETETVIAIGVAELSDARISFAADPLDPSTWLEIESVATHPDFRGDLGYGQLSENDIGAFVLAEPVEVIEPVRLAPVGFLNGLRKSGTLRNAGATFTVVGYGAMRVFPPAQDVDNSLRRFAEVVFGGLSTKWLTFLQNPMVHSGGSNQGDSGGPALLTDPVSGESIQVGVASVSNDVAWNHYTRIDTPAIRDFIDTVIADVEEADRT